MMHGRPILLILGILTLASEASGAPPLTRALDQTTARTNDVIIVVVRFSNPSPNAVRGFYYADQLPSGLNVSPVGVFLNGQATTNYTVETGLSGDVYPGCTPYRWLLERPGNSAVTNPIPAQAAVQIIYVLTATNSGTFPLQPATWVGMDRQTTNALFGFDTSTAPPAVNVLMVLPPSPATLRLTNGMVKLSFATEANVTYHVDYKADLNAANWLPLTNFIGTGTPLSFEEAYVPGTNRFYRVRLP